MQGWRNAAVSAALGVAAALPAAAAGGRIDAFSASALQVQAGDWVTFSVAYSVDGWSYLYGGSSPEPAPQEGYQEWLANWYHQETESLQFVQLQGGGQSYNDSPGVPLNGSYQGGWTFSLQFPDAGSFHIGVGGEWTVQREVNSGSELGTRNCYNLGDPEAGGVDLACDSWQFSYPQYSDWGTVSGPLGEASLQIEVLAAVPEPAAWALWALGAAGLAALRRRRA